MQEATCELNLFKQQFMSKHYAFYKTLGDIVFSKSHRSN